MKKYEDVDAMSVFRYRESIPGQPPAFLQCGDFVYPLVPGKSPVLKGSDHVYMFPELKGKGEEREGRGEGEGCGRKEREREKWVGNGSKKVSFGYTDVIHKHYMSTCLRTIFCSQ